MNERIRELYRQANEQAHQQACEKSKTNRPQNNTVWNEFVPLFSELIVRECADLFDKDEIEISYVERRIHIIIKEHFGVE
jgi:hypothetical protein